MPNTENIRKWIDALRSGEYHQGVGALRLDDKFCCLGVACDLALKDGVGLEVTSALDENEHIEYSYDNENAMLPVRAMAWLGINVSNPHIQADSDYTAAELNDLGEPFDYIASLIESTYLTKDN